MKHAKSTRSHPTSVPSARSFDVSNDVPTVPSPRQRYATCIVLLVSKQQRTTRSLRVIFCWDNAQHQQGATTVNAVMAGWPSYAGLVKRAWSIAAEIAMARAIFPASFGGAPFATAESQKMK